MLLCLKNYIINFGRCLSQLCHFKRDSFSWKFVLLQLHTPL